MKFTAILIALVGSAAAFAPATVPKTSTSLNVSFVSVFLARLKSLGKCLFQE